MSAGRDLAFGQGLFFVASGLWPIVHLPSFEKVTGPKPEGWLVKTVGALIAVGGAALAVASRRTVTREWALLGAGSALALATVDVWYAGVRRRIAPVYLLDAAVELGLAAAWASRWPQLPREAPPARPRLPYVEGPEDVRRTPGTLG
jgi:hypothetical protein